MGCDWDEDVIAAAGECGNMQMVQWLYENGCPIDDKLSIAVVCNGHLHILVWMTKNNIKIAKNIHMIAVRNGQLKCVKWITDNMHCDHDDVMKHVIKSLNIQLCDYLLDNGYPIQPDDIRAVVRYGDIHVFQWVYDRVSSIPDNMLFRHITDPNVLQRLIDLGHRDKISLGVFPVEIRSNDCDMVRVLMDNGLVDNIILDVMSAIMSAVPAVLCYHRMYQILTGVSGLTDEELHYTKQHIAANELYDTYLKCGTLEQMLTILKFHPELLTVDAFRRLVSFTDHVETLRIWYAALGDCKLSVDVTKIKTYQLHTVRWLVSIGCQFTNVDDICTNNRLDILKVLHSNQLVDVGDVIKHAAILGNLRILKWVTGLGYQLDSSHIRSIRDSGYQSTVKWLS